MLSKANKFTSYANHIASFHKYKNRKQINVPPSASGQFIFETGSVYKPV